MENSAESTRALALAHGYLPYTVVEQIDPNQEGGRFREVELMSWPYPEGDKVFILARTVVGDPTTLEQIDVMTLGDVLYRT